MSERKPADEALVKRFLEDIEGLSQREAAELADGVSQNDISRWVRNEWQYLTAAKRRALKQFLDSRRREAGILSAYSDAGNPTGSPAERLIHLLTHPEIVRRLSKHPPMDFVKAAFAYALEEDFSSEEMEKLEAWRRAVRREGGGAEET